MNAFISWILENWPLLGVGLVVISASCVTSWKISRFTKRVEESMDKVDRLGGESESHLKKLEALPCNAHSRLIEKLEDRGGLVDDMNERLESVAKWVMRHDDSMIDSLSRKCSPRRLTEAGKELYSVSGGKKLLEDNMRYFLDAMEKRAPGTPYDVEDCALSVLLSSTAKPMFNGIKNYIYNAPDKLDLPDGKGGSVKVSLSLYSVVWVMGIELRDEYLKTHPEIK